MDCSELNSFSPQLYRNLCQYPREVIPILDDVINGLVRDIRAATRDAGAPGASQASEPANETSMQPINVRPYNLVERRAIRDLDPNDIEALVQVDGMVTRVSNVTPDMRYAWVTLLLPAWSRRLVHFVEHRDQGLKGSCRVAKFICEACQTPVWAANEAGKVKEPAKCSNQACNRKHTIKLVHNQCLFSDKQLIKLQESPNLIPEGETPHAVTAFVYDALVDFVRPGDRITLVGALVSFLHSLRL